MSDTTSKSALEIKLPPDVAMMDQAIRAMIQGAPESVTAPWGEFISELVKWRESKK